MRIIEEADPGRPDDPGAAPQHRPGPRRRRTATGYPYSRLRTDGRLGGAGDLEPLPHRAARSAGTAPGGARSGSTPCSTSTGARCTWSTCTSPPRPCAGAPPEALPVPVIVGEVSEARQLEVAWLAPRLRQLAAGPRPGGRRRRPEPDRPDAGVPAPARRRLRRRLPPGRLGHRPHLPGRAPGALRGAHLSWCASRWWGSTTCWSRPSCRPGGRGLAGGRVARTTGRWWSTSSLRPRDLRPRPVQAARAASAGVHLAVLRLARGARVLLHPAGEVLAPAPVDQLGRGPQGAHLARVGGLDPGVDHDRGR